MVVDVAVAFPVVLNVVEAFVIVDGLFELELLVALVVDEW